MVREDVEQAEMRLVQSPKQSLPLSLKGTSVIRAGLSRVPRLQITTIKPLAHSTYTTRAVYSYARSYRTSAANTSELSSCRWSHCLVSRFSTIQPSSAMPTSLRLLSNASNNFKKVNMLFHSGLTLFFISQLADLEWKLTYVGSATSYANPSRSPPRLGSRG